jgi:hypothetical protein
MIVTSAVCIRQCTYMLHGCLSLLDPTPDHPYYTSHDHRIRVLVISFVGMYKLFLSVIEAISWMTLRTEKQDRQTSH